MAETTKDSKEPKAEVQSPQPRSVSKRPPVLTRPGLTLAWGEDAGAVTVETSHERHSWTIEADIAAGTNTYAPINSNGTEFYRVRSAGGLSNEVVIHFNSPAE